jgi:alpha-tubulin suppressor-like RCC1 family protein
LGLFDVEDKAVWEPTRVHELDATGVLAISSGETSTMVLTNDGDVYSVGVGFKGQLGHQDVVHEKLRHFRKVGHKNKYVFLFLPVPLPTYSD